MSEKKPRSSEVRLTVPFHDLDPMRVVWHGNYLKYFDIARFALFRKAGVEAYIRIVLDFEIRLVGGGKVCARGQGCQVAVQYPEKELLLGLPDDICKALGVE